MDELNELNIFDEVEEAVEEVHIDNESLDVEEFNDDEFLIDCVLNNSIETFEDLLQNFSINNTAQYKILDKAQQLSLSKGYVDFLIKLKEHNLLVNKIYLFKTVDVNKLKLIFDNEFIRNEIVELINSNNLDVAVKLTQLFDINYIDNSKIKNVVPVLQECLMDFLKIPFFATIVKKYSYQETFEIFKVFFNDDLEVFDYFLTVQKKALIPSQKDIYNFILDKFLNISEDDEKTLLAIQLVINQFGFNIDKDNNFIHHVVKHNENEFLLKFLAHNHCFDNDNVVVFLKQCIIAKNDHLFDRLLTDFDKELFNINPSAFSSLNIVDYDKCNLILGFYPLTQHNFSFFKILLTHFVSQIRKIKTNTQPRFAEGLLCGISLDKSLNHEFFMNTFKFLKEEYLITFDLSEVLLYLFMNHKDSLIKELLPFVDKINHSIFKDKKLSMLVMKENRLNDLFDLFFNNDKNKIIELLTFYINFSFYEKDYFAFCHFVSYMNERFEKENIKNLGYAKSISDLPLSLFVESDSNEDLRKFTNFLIESNYNLKNYLLNSIREEFNHYHFLLSSKLIKLNKIHLDKEFKNLIIKILLTRNNPITTQMLEHLLLSEILIASDFDLEHNKLVQSNSIRVIFDKYGISKSLNQQYKTKEVRKYNDNYNLSYQPLAKPLSLDKEDLSDFDFSKPVQKQFKKYGVLKTMFHGLSDGFSAQRTIDDSVYDSFGVLKKSLYFTSFLLGRPAFFVILLGLLLLIHFISSKF